MSAYLSHREHENDEVAEGENKVDHVELLGDVAVVVGLSLVVDVFGGKRSAGSL
jgi:hypothetical protein